jgi:hypothetical protein
MFEFLLTEVGVRGLVLGVASIQVGGGVVAFNWVGNGVVASWIALGWVGNAPNVGNVAIALRWMRNVIAITLS